MCDLPLRLKGKRSASDLQAKFREQQEQRVVEQSLVYLKLREHKCSSKSSLIFAKKKPVSIDGTSLKNGPAGARCLVPVESKIILRNGWATGQKLKYKGTTASTYEFNRLESEQKKIIAAYNSVQRTKEEFMRRERCKSQSKLITGPPKCKLQKINSIKQELLKERPPKNFCLKYSNMKPYETNKDFQLQNFDTNTESLITKLGAFDGILGNQNTIIGVKSSLTQKGRKEKDNINQVKQSHSKIKKLVLADREPEIYRSKSLMSYSVLKCDIQFRANIEKFVKLELLKSRGSMI